MNNETINTMLKRSSLRNYAPKEIAEEDLDLILRCAMQAPTAGNQMLYSILVIRNRTTIATLAKTCDNQPFIAKAPLVLVFLADHQKWFDYYRMHQVGAFSKAHGYQFEAPQESDLLLACADALAAAENAVIAAESLQIGSCYIGDVVENYEIHRKLFDLPKWAMPVAMLCMGYYPEGQAKKTRERFDRQYVVFEETYRHLSEAELTQMFSAREKGFLPNNKYGAENFAQMFYARKTGAAFSKEMARSVRVALKQWSGEILE